MSHFVVLVTNTDEESVESQLEPFYEQGNENDYFMKKDYFVENNQKSVDEWIEKEINTFDELMKNPDATPENVEWWQKGKRELEEIKKVDNLKSQLKMIKEHEGCGQDRKGLYWIYNPNAKWDWWTIGGRWDKWLVKKDGTRCNSCKVKDLDLQGMRVQEILDRAEWYDKEVKKAEEEGKEPFFWEYKEAPTKLQYCKDIDIIPAPFAVLHNEEWIEKGSMGWFGISDDEYSKDEWGKKYEEFINSLDPECEVTIVDCHI